MRPIPASHKKEIDRLEYYKKCVRRIDGGCAGRITIEHALIYASNQIAEMWNYVPLCAYHHAVDFYQDGGDLKKEVNVFFALMQASDFELDQYSKAIDYRRERSRLFNIYGQHYFKGKLLQEANRDVLSKTRV